MRQKALGFLYTAITAALVLILSPSAAAAEGGDIDYRLLRAELGNYLERQKGVYGFFLVDLSSNETAGINERKEFHAASTFKVPMALYVYKRVSEGALEPDRLLAMHPAHMEGGTGRLQFSPRGTRKSVDELVRYSIIYSDNVATNMLLDLVEKRAVKDYMVSLGGEVVDYNNNVTCPRDMALYMREVVRFAGADQWGGRLLNHLQNTVYVDRIPYPLPGDVPVANKIGNWPPTGTYNDVAYVEHPDRPYILAVFSHQAPGYAEAVRVIREISRRVYHYQGNPALAVEINLDGKNLIMADKPFVDRGTTMVPLRALADVVPELSLGWNGATGTITLRSTLSGAETELAIGQADVMIIEGRSYMPVREFCRALDLGLAWDGEKMQVSMATKMYQPVDNWQLTGL